MGIGVYESSQYVKSIGGDIRVESTPGRRERPSRCCCPSVAAARDGAPTSASRQAASSGRVQDIP